MISASISVIVMAFNEVNSLEMVIREFDATLSELGYQSEIVIVDDGSSDGTEVLAERLTEQHTRIRVVHHKTNQGLGAVYRTGFAEARGDFITFFPADGQFPASIIKEFVPLMKNMDMVLGYLPKQQSSLLAKGLALAERLLYKIIFGALPKFQGILMFRRVILEEIELKSVGRGWAVLMELIIRASRKGYKMISVPTKIRPRIYGVSKVNNVFTVWANLKQVIALRYYL